MSQLSESGWGSYVAHESIKVTILACLLTAWVLSGVFIFLDRCTKRRYFTIRTTGWLRKGYVAAGILSLGFGLWELSFMLHPFSEKYRDLAATGFFLSAILQLFIAASIIILALKEARSANRNSLMRLRSEKLKASRLKTAVAAKEHQFHCLFEHSSEAIIITAAEDLRILDLNERAVRFLGISRNDADEQFLPPFCPIAGPFVPAQDSRGEWVNRLCAQRTLTVIKKNGEAVVSEVESSPIEYRGKSAFQFLFREVTDRTRLEEQLRQAEKLSALGQMISGVAHELNNPLSVIKGYLDLIVAHHEIPAQTRSDLEKVIQESNRAIKLVRDFLSFSRGQPARREPVNVNTFIQRVAGLRRAEFAAADVELQLDLGASLPAVPADPDQVQQLIINLLNNAVQAMQATSAPRRLRVVTRLKTPETLLLTIEDGGPGVPPELESRIFEPFFTTKPAGSGTGLGLSIAHGIMADHHGRIYYTRSSLGGAAFHLEFPVPAIPVEPPVPEIVPMMELPPSRPRASARALVLDDEQFIAELLAEMLGVLGHETVVCLTASEALEKVESGHFDLVISDFRMPGMNGEQFYRELIRIKPDLAERTIFLTGDVVNEETQQFLASTGNPHLEKPFQLTRLEAVISGVLLNKMSLAEA